MASGPSTSWQIDGETVETGWLYFYLFITADRDCSHEIKRCLLLRKKVMTNLDSILKTRDITLPTKIHLVKAMVSPVVMYECENWTTKKAECQKNWCCWTVVLDKTLTSPLDCKEIQSALNFHWKDCCWSWSSNNLPTWCKQLTYYKISWCWERLKAGGEGDDRGWDGWMSSPAQWTWVWASSRS